MTNLLPLATPMSLSAQARRRLRLVPLVAFGLLNLASIAGATVGTLLVEFGETLAGEGPGGLWNRYGATTAINGSALKDSLGTTTAISLSFTGQLNVSGNAGTSLTYDNLSAVGNPSWVASSTNNLVAGDLFFTDNGTGGVGGFGETILTFSGFTPGDVVSIDFLGSRNTDLADGFYSFSIDGGLNFSGFTVLNPDGSVTAVDGWSGTNTLVKSFDNLIDGYNNHRYMNASGVVLSGSTLQVKARDIVSGGGNFAALNAMRVTVVPEPASMGLLLLGSTLALRRARGRRTS